MTAVSIAAPFVMVGPSGAFYPLSQDQAEQFIGALTLVKAAPSYVVLRGERGGLYELRASSSAPFAVPQQARPRTAREATMAYRRQQALKERAGSTDQVSHV